MYIHTHTLTSIGISQTNLIFFLSEVVTFAFPPFFPLLCLPISHFNSLAISSLYKDYFIPTSFIVNITLTVIDWGLYSPTPATVFICEMDDS